MEKFVLRSRIGIFREEHTRSTLLDPTLMFWCVSYYLGAFGTIWVPYETRCKTGRTRAKICATKSRRTFRNERTRSTPLDPKIMFWCVFVPFGCIRGRLVAFRNSVQNRPNKCKSSCHEVASEFFATNTPDPTHWTLNSCFGEFHTIWVHWGRLVALRKSVQNWPN